MSEPTPKPATTTRFTVLSHHAEGGLGRVLLARDEQIRRTVALKEIRPERAADPIIRQRFLAEAEITGQLEHPGIVPIYALEHDVEGRPTYAMRFIQGRTLADAVKELHDHFSAHGLRELLRRFIAVCQTIAYAHSKSVIHRDLKPANIMLGDFGETLVVDWGLAKRLNPRLSTSSQDSATPRSDSEELSPTDTVAYEPGDTDVETGAATQAGALLGTPAYMPPEQARGQVDQLTAQSDVYALGAMLYAIVTGQAPYRGSDAKEIVEQVVACSHPPAHEVNFHAPRALSAACAKAMSPAMPDRYASAGELAADVERWLADEPLACYLEPMSKRLARWGRRHRTLVASAFALLITAIIGLVVGLIFVYREKNRTEIANLQTRDALNAESRRREQARRALDRMSSQIVDDWLSRQKKLTPAQKQFLEEAVTAYEEFAADTGNDELARTGAALAQLRVANTRARLRQLPEAEAAYRLARSRFETLAADFPGSIALEDDLTAAIKAQADFLSMMSRYDEAEQAYREALARHEQRLRESPGEPAIERELAKVRESLGVVFMDTGRLVDAEFEMEEAIRSHRKLAARPGSDRSGAEELARFVHTIGNVRRLTGQWTRAEESYREALALKSRLVAEELNNPDYRHSLAVTQQSLSIMLNETARTEQAEKLARESLDLSMQVANEFPAIVEYRTQLASAYNALGSILIESGRFGDAIAAYSAGLNLHLQMVRDVYASPDERAALARAYLNRGGCYQRGKMLVEADADYQKAAEIFRSLIRAHADVHQYQAELTGVLINHASMLPPQFRFKEAEIMWREVFDWLEKLVVRFPRVAEYRQNLAAAWAGRGLYHVMTRKLPEARRDFRAAADAYARLKADFPTVIENPRGQGMALVSLGTFAAADANEAIAVLDEALGLLESVLARNPHDADASRQFRASCWNLADKAIKAGDVWRAARAAEQLPRYSADASQDSFNAAKFLARCAASTAADPRRVKFLASMVVDHFGDRAVYWLEKAAAKGFNEFSRLQTAEFDPIRSRRRFQHLASGSK